MNFSILIIIEFFLNLFLRSKSTANISVLLCIVFSIQSTFSQLENKNSIKVDSLKTDTSIFKEILIDSFTLPNASSDIKSKIEYQAEDSIVFDNISKKLLLYRKSKIDYDQMKVEAYYVVYDWNSGTMQALQKIGKDSIEGKPYMKQDGKDYFTDKVSYNFKSQKGKVYNVVTKEGEGILHGKEVKKDSSKNWYVKNAKYTTCDLEDPHFHFDIKKLKLIPGKAMISGPANLQINNIPTPFTLPFGVFPLNNHRRSGILLPQEYGFSPVLNIRGLGYYFGISDYLDATIRSQIFFNGSYDLKLESRYLKKYQYSGNFTFGTNRIFTGDADNPTEVINTPQNYNLSWTHSQDPKSHPTFAFVSNLNYQTQGFYQNPTQTNERRINAQISSNMSFTKRFRNIPIELRSSINYNQNLANKSVNGQFPNVQMNYYGNIFKQRKKPNSYLNQLQISFNSEFNSQFSSYDSLLLSSKFFKDLKYGIQNRLSFNFGAIKLLKYFNLAPSFNYTDRFYFNRNIKSFDSSTRVLNDNRENGFFSVRDFSSSLNLSTVIIGIKQFGGNGLQGLKHQITPFVGLSFSPNFKSDFWGYYRKIDTGTKTLEYSPYSNNIYGVPGSQANAILNFGVGNALEGKFYNKNSQNQSKKIPLIDVLSFNGSYGLSLDSFKLSNLNVEMSNTINQFLNLRMSLTYNPYVYENKRIVDKLLITNGKGLVQLQNISSSLNLTLNQTNTKNNALKSKAGSEQEREYVYRNYHYFYDFNNPWNLSAAINFNSNNNFNLDTTFFTASIAIQNFDFNVTKNWKLAIRTGYDFLKKEVTQTTISAIRDMHCWEFRFNYTPILLDGRGVNIPAYILEIRPKSGLLQDLKLMRNKPALDNYF